MVVEVTEGVPLGEAAPTRTFSSLVDVFKEYQLVDVHQDDTDGPALVFVTPRATQLADPTTNDEVDFRELGSTSPSPWLGNWMRREYNSDMRGKQGLINYDKMRRSDGTVRGTLRLVKTPVLAARWYMEPASASTRDKNVADFVWKNLTKWMTMSWPQFLTEALLMMDFGYYMFEKVFDMGENVTVDKDAKGKIVWRKLAPRHPMDVNVWYYDANGGPDGVQMYDGTRPTAAQFIDIPIRKLLVFTYDKEAGNMEGMSVLRSAWRNWFYKDQLYKIDAIQKERHGIGVPIIVLPPGFTKGDRNTAEELGRNIRTNERAHVVLPPNWTFMFAELRGQPVDVLKSAVHHDQMLMQQVLASFMGASTPTRSEDQDLYLKATRFIADIVVDVLNKHAIPELVDYNWLRVGYPTICAKRIGEQADWRTLSFAVRNFVGAGIIVPDDPLEANIREEMDLPKADPETARVVQLPSKTMPGQPEQVGGQPPTPADPTGSTATPGSGANVPAPPGSPRVGLPRQKALPPVGTPRSNSGYDRSGG